MSFLSELGLRNLKAHKHAQEFRNTFNRGLPDFWHPEVLRKKWGDKAHGLIQLLVNL
jgi:hypothetical protein